MSNYNYGYIKKVFEEAPSLSYAYEIFLDRLKKLNKDETEKNELYINVKKIYEEVSYKDLVNKLEKIVEPIIKK
jgi:hypothetical protein